MTTPLIAVAGAGLMGVLVGSFLNVVIHRVPRNVSVVSAASRCDSCDSALKTRHKVPVLSWLALRGRCGYCRASVSARYPLVEVGTGTAFAAVTAYYGLSVALPAYLYMAAISITLAMIAVDNDSHVPDALVLPSYVVAVLLLMPAGAVNEDWTTALRALAGLTAFASIYFALALAYPTGMHFSDAKLAGLLGLYLGWASWSALLIGAFGGLAIGACVGGGIAVRRHDGTASIALGPCMIAAAGMALFLTVPLDAWYSSLLGAK